MLVAYTSWVRFYSGYPRDVRMWLDARQLHLGHAAKAFALRETPAALARRAKADPGARKDKPSNRLTVQNEEEKKRPGWVVFKIFRKIDFLFCPRVSNHDLFDFFFKYLILMLRFQFIVSKITPIVNTLNIKSFFI